MDAYWMESESMYALRIPMVETGYVNQGEPIYLSDRLTLAELFSGATIDWNNADQYNPAMVSTYNPATGLFSFNEVWYLTAAGSGWEGNETLQMHGFYIPNYTVEVLYKGIYTDESGAVSAVGNAAMGADATDVRAVVLPQSVSLQSAAAALAALDAPTAALPYVALSEAGRFEVPFDYAALASSKLQIVAVAASEGEAMYATAAPSSTTVAARTPGRASVPACSRKILPLPCTSILRLPPMRWKSSPTNRSPASTV